MPLPPDLRRRLRRELDGPDESRLTADARRLWRRLQRFLAMNLVDVPPDLDALEIACYALQFPFNTAARSVAQPKSSLGVFSLRERTESAALLLVDRLGIELDPDLLDRATRLLFETPQRPPVVEDAKLLADALNLDDFGTGGLLRQLTDLTLRGKGIDQLLEGWDKRQSYGYWDARLNDNFHYPAIRAIAARRFEDAKRLIEMLRTERAEDGL